MSDYIDNFKILMRGRGAPGYREALSRCSGVKLRKVDRYLAGHNVSAMAFAKMAKAESNARNTNRPFMDLFR